MTLNLKTLFSFLESNPTEQDCIKYFEKLRWPDKVVSPHDPTSEVYSCSNPRYPYKCKNTGKYFNVKTRTILRKSKISLKKWFLALHLFSSEEISSYQLAKKLGVQQRTAWFILHRLRESFKSPAFISEMLKGSVEIDETFIGGKNKNRHWDKKIPNSQGRNCKDKIPALGMLERNGNLIARIVPNTKWKTLEPIIKANIEAGSSIYSDEWYRNSNLSESYNHQLINHSAKQYVNGKVHTNSIESFWVIPKRAIAATYYQISRKHAQKYMDEFTFRFNTRKYTTEERFNLALASTVGKRLTYRELTNLSSPL